MRHCKNLHFRYSLHWRMSRSGQRSAVRSGTSWFVSWLTWTWEWSRQQQSFCLCCAKKVVRGIKWWYVEGRHYQEKETFLCFSVAGIIDLLCPYGSVFQLTICWSTQAMGTQQGSSWLEDFFQGEEGRLNILMMKTQTPKNTKTPNLCEYCFCIQF